MKQMQKHFQQNHQDTQSLGINIGKKINDNIKFISFNSNIGPKK